MVKYSKNKKRVAIFLPSLRGGGAERVMVTLANGFAERKLAVDLVLVKAEGPYLNEVAAGVRVVDLKASRVLFSLPRLIGYMRRERPAAMLSALSHANVIAIVARWVAGVPMRLAISERGMPLARGSTSTRVKFFFKVMRAFYRHADVIIPVSKGVARVLSEDFGIGINKIRVIYNPIDLSKIDEMRSVGINHKFISDEFFKIISVGRLEEIKGYDNLLKAMAILGKDSNFRLIILGEGSLRLELQQLANSLDIQDIVDFVGFQKNPFGWMSASDVYVLSSRSDAMPNAMLQALACGVPVISTDCPGGAAEILEKGRWGRLVPVDDPGAMEAAIRETKADPNPPDVRIRATHFNVDTITESYLNSMGIGE